MKKAQKELQRASVQRLSHPDVDFDKAPKWATHAGYDSYGWGWYDHVPYIFRDGQFVKGLLGDFNYPQGKFEYFGGTEHHAQRVEPEEVTGIPPLCYIVRPVAAKAVKCKAGKPVDWAAKRAEWANVRKVLLAADRRVDELEAEAKAAGLRFIE